MAGDRRAGRGAEDPAQMVRRDGELSRELRQRAFGVSGDRLTRSGDERITRMRRCGTPRRDGTRIVLLERACGAGGAGSSAERIDPHRKPRRSSGRSRSVRRRLPQRCSSKLRPRTGSDDLGPLWRARTERRVRAQGDSGSIVGFGGGRGPPLPGGPAAPEQAPRSSCRPTPALECDAICVKGPRAVRSTPEPCAERLPLTSAVAEIGGLIRHAGERGREDVTIAIVPDRVANEDERTRCWTRRVADAELLAF